MIDVANLADARIGSGRAAALRLGLHPYAASGAAVSATARPVRRRSWPTSIPCTLALADRRDLCAAENFALPDRRPDRALVGRLVARGAAARPHARSRRRSSAATSRSSTSAPISGSTTPRPMSAGTRSRIRRPELLGRFVYGIPELQPRRDRRRRARSRPRLLSDLGDPGAEAAARPDRAGHDHRRRRLGRQSARARRSRKRPISTRSTRISPPTGCSTTATPPKWRWRSARPCCSRRISRR